MKNMQNKKINNTNQKLNGTWESMITKINKQLYNKLINKKENNNKKMLLKKLNEIQNNRDLKKNLFNKII